MHPDTKYRLSLCANIVLIAGICCTVLILASDTDRYPPVSTGPYPEAEEYRAYANSVYNGLSMSYSEYLAKKYPDSLPFPGFSYFVTVHPVSSEKIRAAEAGQFVRITDEDFLRHPGLGKLLFADTPFSSVRLTQKEYTDLREYFAGNVLLLWNGTLYQLFSVSDSMIGAVLGMGLFLFACTRRTISEDPASRPMQILFRIREYPGCSMKDIIGKTGFSRGSVTYNLYRLERAKKIRSETRRGMVHYYTVSGQADTTSELLADILAKEKSAKFFCMILSCPGIIQKDLAAAVDLPVSTVQWHLTRMVLDTAVAGIREKKTIHYTVTEEFAVQYRKLVST